MRRGRGVAGVVMRRVPGVMLIPILPDRCNRYCVRCPVAEASGLCPGVTGLQACATSPEDMRRMESHDRAAEALLEALRQALAAGGEQRLYKSGKLDGLFPSKG